MNIKKLLAALLFAGAMAQPAQSQSLAFDYTGELHTAFEDEYNFVNLLWLEGELPIVKDRFLLHASVFSFAKTFDGYLVDDLQGYSNAETDNKPLAPAMACAEWQMGTKDHLFVGVRNVNEDYFISPIMLLFTNSSCGIFPTIGNFPMANYPNASVGLHYKHETDKLTYQLSLYNGRGYNHFFGDETVFQVKPKDDGVFSITELEYKHQNSSYFLGACAHYGSLGDNGTEKTRGSVWGYALQAVSSKVHLIGAYSHSFTDDVNCYDFAGLGARVALGKAELGLFTDYARFSFDEEFATELTCQFTCGEHCKLQPTMHYVLNDDVNRLIGLLRVIVSL